METCTLTTPASIVTEHLLPVLEALESEGEWVVLSVEIITWWP